MIPLAFGLGGPADIAILAGVVVLLFGGSKLAGFGKSAGEAIKEFKKATHDDPEPAVASSTVTPVVPAASPVPTAAVATKTEENS